jgi:diadenosine tetraphosphate (Ap4A) HIT family hydrolase
MFLDERLENDSLFIKDLRLCQLRLMKDGDLPWFLLIPKREHIVEWTDLTEQEQIILAQEITQIVSLIKQNDSNVTKVNIGSLGNMVAQFHVHIIGRNPSDRAWPHAIWGSKALQEFNEAQLQYWQRMANFLS